MLAAAGYMAAQELRFTPLPGDEVVARLRRIERGENAARHDTLRTLLEEAGCAGESLEDQKARGSKLPNLVCSLPGGGEGKLILVTAHFDKVRAGAGAIDNWTGA